MGKTQFNLLSSALGAAACGLSALGFSEISHAATIVDTEISFLVDVSGSVDSSEYALQVDGYINAFRDLDFTDTNFAANFILWSSAFSQAEVVPWTQITDNASAEAFADAIAAATASRPFGGSTAPGSAISYAVPRFGTETGGVDNGFTSTRQIIDVSGDGSENSGVLTSGARDAALAAGIDVINGLPILTDEVDLDVWYRDNVIGGSGAFIEIANDFSDFEAAISKKITKEIIDDGGPDDDGTKIPEPTSVVSLISLATFGVGSMLKRKQQPKA
jgi:hypothetical protein